MEVKVLWSDETQKLKFEKDSVVVLVDVLRASSTIAYALAAGAPAVYLTKDINNALAMKEKEPGKTIIGGERGGIQLDGFDVGNSPMMIPELIKKKKKSSIVLCTGNLCNAISNIPIIKGVIYTAGCLANAKAIAKYILRKKPKRVYFIPVGTYYMINYKGKLPVYTEEDFLGSLYILNELVKLKKSTSLEQKERDALQRFDQLLKQQKRLAQFLQHTLYAEALKNQDKTLGNKKGRVKNINQKDMEYCFKCNKINVVPILSKEKNLFVARRG